MLKPNKIRYKISPYGINSKLTNLYIDLKSLNSKEIEQLDKEIKDTITNFNPIMFGYKVIKSAKSLSLYFSEDDITQKEILFILSDFLTPNMCILYINDKRESLRFLSSIFIRNVDVVGAYLENI